MSLICWRFLTARAMLADPPRIRGQEAAALLKLDGFFGSRRLEFTACNGATFPSGTIPHAAAT